MRAIAAALGAAACGMVAIACVDLFHGTNFETLCEANPEAGACPSAAEADSAASDAGIDTGVDAHIELDFCKLDAGSAHATAEHACAWLAACEGPVGHNAFGQCMFDALQAYDCSIRPEMPVNGVVHDYWQCLALAQSCGDVQACVFPNGFVDCPANAVGFNACSTNGITRVVCPQSTPAVAPAFAENCAGQGRVCYQPNPSGDSLAFCTTPEAAKVKDGGTCVPGCHGEVLSDCTTEGGVPRTIDVGRTCTTIGGGTCDPLTSRCTPIAGQGSCAGSGISCSGTQSASNCTAGQPDKALCTAFNLDGQCTSDAGTVASNGPQWDPSYACIGPSACAGDTCSGSTLTSCFNGMNFTVDCAKQGLGQCTQVAKVPSGPDFLPQAPFAACKKP